MADQNRRIAAGIKNLEPYKFRKGVSGNPGGRAKGIVSYIKSKTNNLKETVDFMVDVMKGEKISGLNRRPALFYRMDAAKWLFEKAVGKTLFEEANEAGYDLRGMLLLELSKHADNGHQTNGKIVEAEQPLQDQDQK